MNQIKVIVIDDHPIVREGIKMLIENDERVTMVGEADNVADGIDLIIESSPDVVLLDIVLGSENSINKIPRLIEAHSGTKVLVVTGLADKALYERAIRNGASGIVAKTEASSTLLKAIRKVHQGEAWIDRSLTTKLVMSKSSGSFDPSFGIGSLTKREREIIRLISKGKMNKEIANELNITEKTVRNILTVIYSKLDVSNRLELAIFASDNWIAE